MYYGLILIAVMLFGGSFASNDAYRIRRGSGIKISLQFSVVSSLCGLAIMMVVNKGIVEFTPFTLLMAVLIALNGMAFTFCGFKALGKINLSMYSLYSMLGGMLLPFMQGIIFYNEGITVAKIVCCIFIFLALLLTVSKGRSSGGTIYYIGIFVLNGMSGVLTKLFTSLPYEKADAMSFSIISAMCSVIISAILLFLFFRKKDDISKESLSSLSFAALNGVTNRIANLILVISLVHIETSAQYPLVTGGVMIVSTLICFFKKNKPTKKELASVLLAFLGMVAMFAIPV